MLDLVLPAWTGASEELLLILILVLDVLPQLPLVDVFVDRVCALIEGALEEQGAHDDGEGEGRGPAEQQGVQPRSQRRGRPENLRMGVQYTLCLYTTFS